MCTCIKYYFCFYNFVDLLKDTRVRSVNISCNSSAIWLIKMMSANLDSFFLFFFYASVLLSHWTTIQRTAPGVCIEKIQGMVCYEPPFLRVSGHPPSSCDVSKLHIMKGRYYILCYFGGVLSSTDILVNRNAIFEVW